MRLNYQNSSNCGLNSVFLWYQQLHRYLNTIVVNIYIYGYSYIETLLNVFRKCYKRVSLAIYSRVEYATGEVSINPQGGFRDGRGSVVPIIGKGPKYLIGRNFIRSYTIRSREDNLVPVQEQKAEMPKGLDYLAKH